MVTRYCKILGSVGSDQCFTCFRSQIYFRENNRPENHRACQLLNSTGVKIEVGKPDPPNSDFSHLI
jgi:hypothetical protein